MVNKIASVLVADDVDLNRVLLMHLLKPYIDASWQASDGLQAFFIWEKENVDVVFMDIEMPECDGLTATKRILAYAHETSRRIPYLVAVTGHTQPREQTKIWDAGFHALLAKPFNAKVLSHTLLEMQKSMVFKMKTK